MKRMRSTSLPLSIRLPIVLALLGLLAACDIPGLGPDPRIAQREEEAKAIGGACRYALRGIEGCYANNPKASKAAIFAGWKDMDSYMRDNKIEGIPASSPAAPSDAGEASAPASAESAAAKK